MKKNIVALCGSLREGSYNRSVLKKAYELLPNNISLNEVYIGDLPLYNEDMEDNMPKSVKDLKSALKEADGVLLVTPEYNYSVSGVLKNALDWASRGEDVFDGKTAAIISASMSDFGGVRAQGHLRQICLVLGLEVISDECFIPAAHTKFDDNLNLIDERAIKSITSLLESLSSKL